MKFFLKSALVVYTLLLTAAFAGLLYFAIGEKRYGREASETNSIPQAASFSEINVERINIREPDGTLRMALYSRARKPGIIVKNNAQPHPDRDMAGMLFYNDEGTELGGLVYTGMKTENGVISGGSLTFDRYEQDQIIQLIGAEQGDTVFAGLYVNDRPEQPMDFDAIEQWRTAEPGPEKDALLEKTNMMGGAQRAFFGRAPDKSSQVVLRDAEGRQRLVMKVAETGAPEISFYDEDGNIVKRIAADE